MMFATEQENVIDLEKARITMSEFDVRLETSVAVLTHTTAGTVNSSGVWSYDAGLTTVDGARHPVLAAVWENEDDSIYDNL